MRIGIDARLADYTVGGIARYTVQLISALHGLNSDHEIVAVRSRLPKVPPPILPCASVSVRTPPHHRVERYSLPWEIRGAGFDLLHSPDFIIPWHGGWPLRRGWRSVVTIHDLAFLRMPGLLTSASGRYYGGVLRSVQEADAIIAVSQATARDVQLLLDAPAEKVSIVYEAADRLLAPMPDAEAAALVEQQHGLRKPYILFVGTLEPRKNLPVLLQAFAKLRRDFPVRLAIAGARGWLSDDIFGTVRRLAVEDGVHFIGEIPPADLRPLYCAAELLVLPSLYEGFGLPPLEAMACGTPVVVSDAGSLPEIVGEAGVIVRAEDPDDIAQGLGWVLGNAEFRSTLSRRGLERASTFSWERAARETMAVYERVLAA